MIERHYGALLDGAHAGIAGRLDAHEAELQANAEDATVLPQNIDVVLRSELLADVQQLRETAVEEPGPGGEPNA